MLGRRPDEIKVKGTIDKLQILLRKEPEILKSADGAGDEGTIDHISGCIGEQEKQGWSTQLSINRPIH